MRLLLWTLIPALLTGGYMVWHLGKGTYAPIEWFALFFCVMYSGFAGFLYCSLGD